MARQREQERELLQLVQEERERDQQWLLGQAQARLLEQASAP